MKKTFISLIILCSLVAFPTSCGKDEPVPSDPTEKPEPEKPEPEKPGPTPETVELSVRATAPGSYEWSAGDEFAIWTSKGRFVDFNFTSAETGVATFTARVEKDEPAVGPAVCPSEYFDFVDGKLTFNMPSEFSSPLEAGTFCPMAAVTGSDGSFAFARLLSAVKAEYRGIPADNEACAFVTNFRINGTLEVALDGETPALVLDRTENETENFVSAPYIANDEATSVFTIPVPATTYEKVSVSLGSSDAQWVIETSLRNYENVTVELGSEKVLPVARCYKTKQYGDKYWFVEACKEEGDGTLGRSVDFTGLSDDQLPKITYENTSSKGFYDGKLKPWLEQNGISSSTRIWTSANGRAALEFLQKEGVRYYTWSEAMTGVSNASYDEVPMTGTDAVGHEYDLQAKSGEEIYNVQLKGCCPDGYHVANFNDWWDLLHSIKTEYNVPDNVTSMNGYYFPGDATHGYNTTIGDGTDVIADKTPGAGFSFTSDREYVYDNKKGELLTTKTKSENITKEFMFAGDASDYATNINNLGNVVPWLIGPYGNVGLYSGGLWNHFDCPWIGISGVTESTARVAVYIKDGGNTGFNWYQFGSCRASDGGWNTEEASQLGDWVGLWLPGTYDDDKGSHRGRGYCLRRPAFPSDSGSPRNFSINILFKTWDQSSVKASIPVRCVKNYDKTKSDFE